ncbi:MAG: hypothetical protein ABW217_11755 [Polyangiaceae bacterium]
MNVVHDPGRGRWFMRLGALAAVLRIGLSEEAIPRVQALDSTAPAASTRSYRRLSETGLYGDSARHALASDVVAFAPTYELWSDGAKKTRWIALPPGTAIDAREVDHFRFPVGTRVWKEFELAGKRLETRLIERTGAGPNDYWMGAFAWDADGNDASFVEQGRDDVLGTEHDVPAAWRCASCHGGEPGRILGLSAVQLAPPLLAELAATGRLAPAPSATEPLREASPSARRALGYLHANCGHCHSDGGIAFRDVELRLRLDFDTPSAESSAAFRATVGRAMQRPGDGPALRIAPGVPDESGLVTRMRSRSPSTMMPPLGSEHTDAAGVLALGEWIASLGTSAQR